MRPAFILTCAILLTIAQLQPAYGQETANPAKPTEHLVGTVTSNDAAAQTVTVKEDGNGLEHVIQLQNTRTLLKVSPGAKDLKAATRISPSDLSAGDRVDVRGSKADADPNAIAARSVVLMSSRELQQAHQNQASAWQHSTGGTVMAVDPADKKITINARSAEGPKTISVDAASAVFTRYSPEHPKNPTPSQMSEVQAGDQVKIIGEKNAEGTSIAAQQIYSGSFKTLAGTISSIASDGKSLVLKDLTSKQSVTIALADDAGIHKLPPMLAMMLARRFNPDMKDAAPAGVPGNGSGRPAENSTSAGAPAYGAKAGEGSPGQSNSAAGPGGPRGGGRMASGDLSQMLDRLPKITTSDLKNGDAVVVSGSPAAAAKATLLATSVIAGVEPIFQSASGRQAQSLGDWGASLGGGAAMDAGTSPQ